MILKRPDSYELSIDCAADHHSSILALSLAALRTEPTTINRIECTEALQPFVDFLASGGIRCHWQERTVLVEPGERQPFEPQDLSLAYEAFATALVLAATRPGSSLRLSVQPDDTIKMVILGLRRLGAELEFTEGDRGRVIIHQPVSRPIKYQLQKESAKITPYLVLAMSTVTGDSEITDLFTDGRYDYLFAECLSRFERQSLAEPEPDDELERRLRKQNPMVREFNSLVKVNGGLAAGQLTVSLRPDVEFAAYLAAGVMHHREGTLLLRNFKEKDMIGTPLAQLRRMGGNFRQVTAADRLDIALNRSPLKARRVAYEQLHAYPDSVGALLLASAPLDATTVVHSARYTTTREEQRRRRLCDTIKALGVRAAEIRDGIVLEGKNSLETLVEVDSDDPVAELTAVAAALGPTPQVTLESTAAAEARWGEAFRTVLNLFD